MVISALHQKLALGVSGAALVALSTPTAAVAQEAASRNDTSVQNSAGAETSRQVDSGAGVADGATNGVFTQDIVVTAQRRSENVQNVSAAISALSGEQIASMNIQDATRVADLVPNFKAGGLGGPGGPPFFSIRGISFIDFSNLNEASVALYVDDVYQVAQGAGAAQLFDTQRVEVLRGPQGTLFGRNTTAGVVHYVSRLPTDEFQGDLSLQYGQNNQRIISAAIGGPLASGIRVRGAFKLNQDDGFQKNLAIGGRDGKTDAISGRIIAQLDLTPDWMVEGNFHFTRSEGISPAAQPMFIYGPNSGRPGVPTGYCAGLTPPNPAIGGPTPDGSPGDLAWAACIRGGQGYGRNGQRISGQKADENYASEHYPVELNAHGGYFKIIGDLGWGTLTSITALEHYKQLLTYDSDGWDNRPITHPVSDAIDRSPYFRSSARQFSQEIRLGGRYNGINWVGGVYYYNAKQSIFNGTEADVFGSAHGQAYDPITNNALGCAPGVSAPPGTAACVTAPLNQKTAAQVDTRSYAFFGQVDVPLSRTLTTSIGLRYTGDDRKLVQFDVFPACTTPATCGTTPNNRVKNAAMTGRAALELRPAEDVLYYAQYSHGFKSGGFAQARLISQRGPVDEETIDSFELGMRHYFFDRSLRFNATAFYYKFYGLQANVGSVDGVTGAVTTLYLNAGDPHGYGLELETAWAITENFEALLNVGLLKTRIVAPASLTADGRPLNGNSLAQAPEVSLNGALRYTIPLPQADALTFQLDGRWQSESFAGVDNDPSEIIDSFGVLNARVQWRSANRNITVEGFVDNVLNKLYFQHYTAPTPGTYIAVPTVTSPAVEGGTRMPGRPRLWGVRVSYRF